MITLPHIPSIPSPLQRFCATRPKIDPDTLKFWRRAFGETAGDSIPQDSAKTCLLFESAIPTGNMQAKHRTVVLGRSGGDDIVVMSTTHNARDGIFSNSRSLFATAPARLFGSDILSTTQRYALVAQINGLMSSERREFWQYVHGLAKKKNGVVPDMLFDAKLLYDGPREDDPNRFLLIAEASGPNSGHIVLTVSTENEGRNFCGDAELQFSAPISIIGDMPKANLKQILDLDAWLTDTAVRDPFAAR